MSKKEQKRNNPRNPYAVEAQFKTGAGVMAPAKKQAHRQNRKEAKSQLRDWQLYYNEEE